MKKTRIIALLLALVAIVGVFASCNRVQKRIAGVTIKITDRNGDVMANGIVTVEDTDPTVLMAIEQFLQEQDIPFAEDSYGNSLAVIGDVDNSDSDSEYFWTFKINGKDPEMGMAAELVWDQDVLTVYCKKNPYANAD
ncbi:MAG: DUF4430 domain-containing protein [Ruminococcaceae bacterium]|nr:DUF4430 domain-containing protein [Oscillospiraceae bacterium]